MSSCSKTEHGEEKKYHIGVSQCSSGYWRDKLNNEMQRELLQHEGVTLEFLCADDDDAHQIKDIKHFIDEGVDAIIVSPNSEEPISEVIGEAYDKGIPVILFDRYINSDKYTTFVGGDNIGVGEALASFVINNIGAGGTVIELMGNMHTSPARQRHEGFMRSLASHKNIKILASVDARWDSPKAKNAIDSLFAIYPDVDVIVAHSDFMVSGAKEEADKLRPGNKIKYIGADGFGSPGLGIFAVAKGEIDATAVYPTGGDVIMRTALNILDGKKVKKENLLPSHVVTSKKDASLLVALNDELNNEVNTIMLLRDKVTFYDNQLELERTLILFMIGFLAVSISLIIAFMRLYVVKRRSNERLQSQQKTLSEQHAQLLQVTKELEEATNAKLMFFTNISHDFRTPLTLISAPIDSAIKQIDSKKDTKGVLHLLQLAQRNVQVLLDLVNQILDFRKIENGKMELHLAPVNIEPLLEGWFESFNMLANHKDIRMEIQMNGTDWNVVCDQKRIERMVFNLIGNSMKFTPRGGLIQMICTRTTEVLQITIVDNGIGIDKENLESIFERFYQIENSHDEGTGIGLALVKSIVELMHGRIEIESNTDSRNGETGTRITLILPMESAKNEVLEQKTPVKSALQPVVPVVSAITDIAEDEERPVILIIDDNEDIRTYISTLLGEQYRVIMAVDGAMGVKVATETIPDLILCDVMMPVMNGLECCHHLKTDVNTSHIPVLLLTACSLDEQRVEGLSEGAEAYISKPFSSEVLMAQIETLLRNRTIVRDFYRSVKEPLLPAPQPERKTVEANVKETPSVPTKEQNLSKYDAAFIEKLKNVINERMSDEKFNVEVLSDVMCMSRAQLYRKCKALVGESPVELIRNSRLVKAQELLISSSIPVSDVAKMVGIPDASYFTKCYKTYFGVLPSACNT